MKNYILLIFLCPFLFYTSACRNDAGNFEGGNFQKAQAPPAEDQVTTEQSLAYEPPQTDPDQPAPTPPPPPRKQPEKEAPIPRQIIKTANYRIQVKEVSESAKRMNQLAVKHGGFISASELTNSSYEITNAITVRVPAARFDSLLGEIGQEATFTQYLKISSQDVTEEYVDITLRLKTKKEVRDRYVDILRNKAKTVEDVLKAEEQIRIIQEEIEAKEGRLRYLKDQVAMSTIHLQLFQTIEYRPEPSAFRESFWTKLGEGLKTGWDLLQGIVVGLVTIWPLIILVVLLWWRRRWIWAKLRRKKAA